MKTIAIRIPELASDEDKILEIIRGLKEISAFLDDIILDEESEAGENIESAIDDLDSAIESLNLAIDLLELENDDEERDENEGETPGLHITIEFK